MRLTSSATRFARYCVVGLALAALPSAAHADSSRARICSGVDYNAMILRIIKRLPVGGGYSLNSKVVEMPTVTAHNIGGGNWEMRVYDGKPTHCTGATYGVFVHLVAMLQNSGVIQLSPDQLQSLAVLRTMPDGSAREDGEGPFAIFNSNGAGAAALVNHTGTGFSFRDDKLTYARPGDFVKLFWNGNVGSNEQGHQAIFTGHREVAGREMICFWSSQRQNRKRRGGRTEALYFSPSGKSKIENGYGEVCRPRGDVKAMVFSRITCMEHLAAGLTDMARKAGGPAGTASLFVDDYLYTIRTKPSNHATLDRKYNILPAAPPPPVPATFADSGIAPLR